MILAAFVSSMSDGPMKNPARHSQWLRINLRKCTLTGSMRSVMRSGEQNPASRKSSVSGIGPRSLCLPIGAIS